VSPYRIFGGAAAAAFSGKPTINLLRVKIQRERNANLIKRCALGLRNNAVRINRQIWSIWPTICIMC
jgi:hypothetical protein